MAVEPLIFLGADFCPTWVGEEARGGFLLRHWVGLPFRMRRILAKRGFFGGALASRSDAPTEL